MPLMIKLNRNIMKIDLCLDNGHFITVNLVLKLLYRVNLVAKNTIYSKFSI